MNVITINGKSFSVEDKISYQDIVDLADSGRSKEALHTVVYHHKVPFEKLPGERDGTVTPGKSVATSPGMHITAVVTDNA